MRETDPDAGMAQITPLLVELQTALDSPLNLSGLAERYGYSPYHFHRVFTEVVGESPRRYVERLRMEKAAYKLWITDESILDIALSVGFKNHETFSRACRRYFHTSPRELRAAGRSRKQGIVSNHRWQPKDCVLSNVRFQRLRPMNLLAIRNIGGYGAIPDPFENSDRLWSRLVEWADAHDLEYQPIALCIFYDNPWLTPEAAQQADACIPVVAPVKGTRTIRCIPFEGGEFGTIEHIGPVPTRWQAFRKLADTIHASEIYAVPPEPSGAISIKALGEDGANRMEVCLKVTKKKQEATKS
jgi:AraC family transcriptional regulator